MEEVAEFLGVKWQNSLLKPTVNGMPAHANSMYKDQQVTGMVRKATKEKWRSVLTKAELRSAIGTLPDAKRMGYEWQKTLTDSVLLMVDKGRTKVKNLWR